MDIIDIIVYIIIILAMYKVYTTEKDDMLCPHGPSTTDKNLCKEGNGKSYHGSLPQSTDKLEIIMNKINIAATAYSKEVIWRKYFMLAIVTSFFICFLVLEKVPSPSKVFLIICIIMILGYFNQCFYNYHHYKHMEDSILKSTNIILKRLNNIK
jgi:hypothetical protein